MTSSVFSRCRHPDVRNFGEVRCCLSCGSAHIPKVYSSLRQADHRNTETPCSINTRYKYQPLEYELGKEVRLVVLHPGAFDDELYCEILHKNLKDNPEYHAVSYTWANRFGDATLKKAISCKNGGQIPITESCEGALRRIRLRGLRRVIWVDMLSIDQQNIQERNHQVSLMKDIYSSATQVLVDLGEGDAEADFIFNEVAHLSSDRGSASRKSLEMFFERRWFHRVWVLQEIALAQYATIFCGTMSVNWGSLTSFMSRKSTEFDKGSFESILPTVFQLRTTSIKTWSHARLLDLLVASRACQSTDPRDKIYALLSLLDPHTPVPIEVDYSQSASSLFLQVAIWCVNSRKDWNILLHVHQPLSLPSLPSWAPDWTLLPNLPIIEPYIPLSKSAPFIERRQICETSFSSMVRMQGRKLGNVWIPEDYQNVWIPGDYQNGQVPSKQRDHSSDFKDYLHDWQLPLKRCSHLEANYRFWRSISWKNKNDQPENWVYGIPPAFGGVICSRCCYNSLSAKYRARHKYDTRSAFSYKKYPEWAYKLTGESKTQNNPESSKLRICDMCLEIPGQRSSWRQESYKFNHASFNGFTRQLGKSSKGRKLFATEASLGFGPNSMQTGDSVWLLESQQVPFILRERVSNTPVSNTSVFNMPGSKWISEYEIDTTGSGTDTFRFDTKSFEILGACYLHEAARDYDICATCNAQEPERPREWQITNIK